MIIMAGGMRDLGEVSECRRYAADTEESGEVPDERKNEAASGRTGEDRRGTSGVSERKVDLQRFMQGPPNPKPTKPTSDSGSHNNTSAAHSDRCAPRDSEDNELIQAIREVEEAQHQMKWAVMKIEERQLHEANRAWKRREKQRQEKEQATAAVFAECWSNPPGPTAHCDPPEEIKTVETQTNSAAVGRLREPLPEPQKKIQSEENQPTQAQGPDSEGPAPEAEVKRTT
jgi:hypothetical protein